MKPKSLPLIINILLLIFLMTGCTDSLPIFKATDIDDDRIACVIIDEIEYKMYPNLKWWPLPEKRKTIGYAGSRRRPVSILESDYETNFIFVTEPKLFYEEAMSRILHRTDVDIPNPSESSVDRVVYREQDYREDEIKTAQNITENKEIIGVLFDYLENGDKKTETFSIPNFCITLSCYSNDVPGMVYLLGIDRLDNKILVGNFNEGYVEIPQGLLIDLAGYELDVEELLTEQE